MGTLSRYFVLWAFQGVWVGGGWVGGCVCVCPGVALRMINNCSVISVITVIISGL